MFALDSKHMKAVKVCCLLFLCNFTDLMPDTNVRIIAEMDKLSNHITTTKHYAKMFYLLLLSGSAAVFSTKLWILFYFGCHLMPFHIVIAALVYT